MADNKEKKTVSAKLNSVMEKNRVVLLVCLVVVVVGLVAAVVVDMVSKKSTEKNLAAVDAIYNELITDSLTLDDAGLAARSTAALDKLNAYTSKSGVSGVRANKLAAELAFIAKDYEAAISYYDAAAKKGKKAYTAPISYYNMGVCYEQLGKLEDACASYKLAAESEDFALACHANFSYGRVLETLNKYDEAVAVYQAMNDAAPADDWSKLAKSRIIALQAEGKIQ